jgi:hypothetical protein
MNRGDHTWHDRTLEGGAVVDENVAGVKQLTARRWVALYAEFNVAGPERERNKP